jgi:drug/metabolite transporter (DMT)-like permease
LLAGILDVSANALYLYAKEFTRLDVAAVLTSLYPAVTVLLACMLLKEKISRMQWGGVILCVTAIGLIVL